MGRRGPSPKPTALRVLHGDRPAKTNFREPVPPDGPIEPLHELSADARSAWEHLVSILEHMHVVTAADVLLLELLCDQVAVYRRAVELVNKVGVVTEGASGAVKRNPAQAAAADAARLIRALAQEFGLTPAARAQLVAGALGTSEDPRERFFS